MTDESAYVRGYAREIGVNPPVSGADNVQDALAAGATGGASGFVQVTNDLMLNGLFASFPISSVPVGTAAPPVGGASISPPLSVFGAGTRVVIVAKLKLPDFTFPVATDVSVTIFVSNVAGDNTLSLNNELLGVFGPGFLAGDTYVVDFGVHVPTIVGADLIAAGSEIHTTAGGAYGCVVSYFMQPD